jgi:LPS sulfotransferase NodH
MKRALPADLPRSSDLLETPFFIVGNPRSGTTLLRFILSSHSRIYIPEETGFLPHICGYAGRMLSRPEVEELVLRIGRMNSEWRALVSDFDAFYASLPSPTLMHVLDQLYGIKLVPHHAVRWGDKGPSYVRVLSKIDRIFPTAVYIHVIRDGRDCTLSALKKWGRRYWYYDTYYLMRTWSRNVQAGRSAGQWLGPGRYLEIRYEELVSDVTAVVKRICDFLGERFEPQMLDHTGLARQLAAPTGHLEVEQPVTRRSAGNWRQNMLLFDQKVALRVAGRQLSQLGYDVPKLPPLNIAEWVRYAALAGRFFLIDSLRRLLYCVGWLKMSREKRGRESHF